MPSYITLFTDKTNGKYETDYKIFEAMNVPDLMDKWIASTHTEIKRYTLIKVYKEI